MASKIIHISIITCFWTLAQTRLISAQNSKQFIYNGFRDDNLYLSGPATIQSGILELTDLSKQITAHAFYPTPIEFSSSSSFSFSTTFAFAMYPQIQAISGHGIFFLLSPSVNFPIGLPGKFFGVFNSSADFRPSNHIFGVELDTIQDYEFNDIDSNHVGINVNSLISNVSAPASYFSDVEKKNKSLLLISGKPLQMWINYNHSTMIIQVTLAPLGNFKPSRPLLSTHINLSDIILDTMYVGFTSSTGSVASTHYLLGWSFAQGGMEASELNLSKLPDLPKLPSYSYKKRGLVLSVGLRILLMVVLPIVVVTVGLVVCVIRRKKFGEILEDWEQDHLIQRFSYKDLYKATKGFKEQELIGAGGFGKVYKGVLKSPTLEVAVKKFAHGSGQGMKEFLAEVACMGRLRHRNLVQLLGYCHKKGELMLVYNYMPNGSLDKYLYKAGKPILPWNSRLKMIHGVASALVYLHEEGEQVVVHRDVKASNILLDAEMNARLGDFGVAKLYDHGSNPYTTNVVGTVGYIAPELTRNGKATTSTDVFSFGVFLLEIACGKCMITIHDTNAEIYLIDWVYECWKKGDIIEATDPKLGDDFVVEEMELVLKLGMLCCSSRPDRRPTMRQVKLFLNGDYVLPETITPYMEGALLPPHQGGD